MKRYLIIPGALLAFILFSAKSCDEDPAATRHQAEETMLEVMDSVKAEFGVEYLDEESLFVFTQKAKQKLRDYSDYMNVFNDTSLAYAFRTQARDMTTEIFYLNSWPIEPTPGKVIRIDSVWLTEPLHRTGDEQYKGELGFMDSLIQKSDQDTIPTRNSGMNKVEFLVIKQHKIIGTDTLKIWQVFLGGFRLKVT
ncbi:MAG: hypothetical protein IH596_09730 [Bacteroidales bacterium]|nr:hypothetical protein [Bacteroidales bacterium]